MRTSIFLLLAVLLAILLPVGSPADVQVWDVWVYGWVRVNGYTYNEYGVPIPYQYDIYNNPHDVSANPIECSEDYYNQHLPDRFRFTFDGARLSLNGSMISTVGGSSQMESDLLLSGSWAVCGSVADGVLTPDPYATFASGQVHWAAGTPIGYTASLLLGYSFQGDGAPMYQQHPTYSHPLQQGTTIMVRTYSPRMGYDYPDSYSSKSHVFTATHVPEPASALVLFCCLGMYGARRKMRR